MLSQLHNVYNSCQVLTRKRRVGENARTGSAVTYLGEFCMCLWLQLPCTVPEWSQSNHCLHCRTLHRRGLTPSTTAPQSGLWRFPGFRRVTQSNVTVWVSTSGRPSRCLWCTLEAGQRVCSEVTAGLCWHSCLREYHLYDWRDEALAEAVSWT